MQQEDQEENVFHLHLFDFSSCPGREQGEPPSDVGTVAESDRSGAGAVRCWCLLRLFLEDIWFSKSLEDF